MAYLYGLIVVGLFFGVMHFYTELDTRQKMSATVFVLVFVMGAIFYNLLQRQKAEHLRGVILHFNQGKALQCGAVTVSKADFTLSEGTQTFIGKKEGVHAGRMLQASGCE